MRPHGTYSTTQPYTHIYINDAFNETPTSMSTPRVPRFPTAVLGLALGIGLAVLAMLGTWLSLSTRATDRATTFIVHSKGQTLSANELDGMGILPAFLDDILTRF
jgi:hypothetical protein